MRAADSAESCGGVLVLQRRPGTPRRLGVDQRQLLDALARQAALAIARVQLADQAQEAALRARTGELRSALLSTVSHDLRTPLSVITSVATSLVPHGDDLTPPARNELLLSIVEDARRLERVLSNLLQLTRAETGVGPDAVLERCRCLVDLCECFINRCRCYSDRCRYFVK